MKNKLLQYKEMILYVFFGGCTTLVNIITYYLCAHLFEFNTSISTIVAWFLSVLFAYITNKLFVFESKSFNKNIVIKEVFSFFGCRLATGILDLIIMVIFVDYLLMPDLIIKIISNIIVVILNYVASKLFIFK